jgi:hypothetical protein
MDASKKCSLWGNEKGKHHGNNKLAAKKVEKMAIKQSATRLNGTKEIAAYTCYPWKAIQKWIANDGFPAVQLNSYNWTSNSELIDKWIDRKISGMELKPDAKPNECDKASDIDLNADLDDQKKSHDAQLNNLREELQKLHKELGRLLKRFEILATK